MSAIKESEIVIKVSRNTIEMRIGSSRIMVGDLLDDGLTTHPPPPSLTSATPPPARPPKL